MNCPANGPESNSGDYSPDHAVNDLEHHLHDYPADRLERNLPQSLADNLDRSLENHSADNSADSLENQSEDNSLDNLPDYSADCPAIRLPDCLENSLEHCRSRAVFSTTGCCSRGWSRSCGCGPWARLKGSRSIATSSGKQTPGSPHWCVPRRSWRFAYSRLT